MVQMILKVELWNCTLTLLIIMFFYLKVSSPLGNYKRVVMAEEMYSVIDQVHQHDVCHSGVFKTYRKVLFIDSVFGNIF